MKTFKIFALGAVALLGTLLTASAKDLVILHT